MKYVFLYNTIVNRDYNIYKEIITNPFIFSFLGVYDPTEIKNIVDYFKSKDANILKNIIPGMNLNTAELVAIYKILLDYNFFLSEPFNFYSEYIDNLLKSSKVDEVIILINDIDDLIEEQESKNVKDRFKSHAKIKVIRTKRPFISSELKSLDWDCVSFRDVEQAIELINSDVSIKGKDIILDESSFNKIDPVNYILLQEKEARVDYRSMI
jgi:hypothetical protein